VLLPGLVVLFLLPLPPFFEIERLFLWLLRQSNPFVGTLPSSL
jgi:hypothetical protein